MHIVFAQPLAWRFDFYSALIGFGAAWLIVLALFLLRKPIGALRERVTTQAAAARTYVTSGVEARYRQSLARAAQRSHLAGRLVDLDDIFIPPRLFAHQPIAEPGEDQADLDITYVVPKFADCPELAALYGAPAITLEEALQSPASLLIVGKPGAGKSTILAHIAARVAEGSGIVPGHPVPIFVHVADVELPVPEKKDLAEPLLIAAEARAGLLGGTGAAEHLAGRLRRGECLVLLDGWDDLPAPHQAEVVKWLKTFVEKYPVNRIIATGPAAGYEPLLPLGLAVAPVDGWTPDDFRQLVNRWTTAWPKIIAKRKRKPAADQADPALIAGWLSGGSRGRTPLDVTLRIWTALEGDVLGPRPADWLASYVARLLPTPDGLRALERAAFDSLAQDRLGLALDKIRAHASAAFAASTAKLPMDPADFVEVALEAGGLLVRRAGNRASLSHPVVAAYLAAASYAVAGKPEPFLNQPSPAFALAFPFYASLGDATPLVAERFQKAPDLAFSDLIAVGQWIADAPSNARWRGEAFRRLAALLVASDKSELLRGRALVALVGSRDESVNQLFKQSLASPDPVVRTYAALGLGASGEPAAVPALIEKLADPARPVQYAAALALAVIGDTPAVEALAGALLEGDETLRKAAAEALALHREEGHAILRDAIAENDLLTRRAAIWGLRRVGARDDVLKLLEDVHLNDTQWVVRGAAEEAIAQLKSPPDRSPRPLPAPETMGWLVAWAAKRGEGVAPGAPARNALRRAANEGDGETRIAAALTLGRLADADAIPDLKNALTESEVGVREAAFEALFQIGMAMGQRLAP